jgi:RNA polymerase sigma-70 factor, ECF subfamily
MHNTVKIPTEENAFRDLFEEYYAPLVLFAFNYVKDQDEAEEMVQEVMTNVWIKAETITITSSVKSYLYGCVRNACLNHLKHQKIVNQYQSHQLATAPASFDETPLELEELQEKLRTALDKIPARCREVFELNRFEGLRYKEIAAQLNLSLKTVENQMGKALKILREELGDYLYLIIWSSSGMGVIFELIVR